MHADSGLSARGDAGMGFLQDKTTHHFRLRPDGGSIEVSANDPTDKTSRDQIRAHLGHIATMFQRGNFEIPMFVHNKMPDGAATMKKDQDKIRYAYEETSSGGRVRIHTTDPEALEAVHGFLRFQIAEHRTGDTTQVSKS
jgi:hypothetical protein